MKQLLLLLLSLFCITEIHAQTSPIIDTNLELTKKNMKRVFSIKPGFCCPEQMPEWIACYNTDSTYNTADTLTLYSDQYHYLGAHCCYITSWSFLNSSSFSLSRTHVCEEPPVSIVSIDDLGFRNYNYKIKYRKVGTHLTMCIYKKGKLKDRFKLIALENDTTYGGKPGYKLTMVRRI